MNTRHRTYAQPLGYVFVVSLVLTFSSSAFADHGGPENILPVTKGVYRLPFANGTQVRISGDHITHDPHNRLDMSPTDNSVQHNIVAAGDGVIEYIQDSFDVTCPSAESNPNPCQNYNGPSGTCCVRGTPGCDAMCRNNYVWIRHPNGEWSKYTHMRQGSVPNNLAVGQFVSDGTVIGVEGDVGRASGVHLHLEFGVPDVVDTTLPPGDPNYDPLGIDPDNCAVCGFPNVTADDAIVIDANRQNRIPVFCQIGVLADGDTVEAVSCDGQCGSDNFVLGGTISNNEIFYQQVTTGIGNDGNVFVVENGAGAAIRGGSIVRLTPGFHAEAGSFFSASIGACDSPGF
jgi:hypothetical protein